MSLFKTSTRRYRHIKNGAIAQLTIDKNVVNCYTLTIEQSPIRDPGPHHPFDLWHVGHKHHLMLKELESEWIKENT